MNPEKEKGKAELINKSYLGDITATNIYEEFYPQDGGENYLAYTWNEITSVTLCIEL